MRQTFHADAAVHATGPTDTTALSLELAQHLADAHIEEDDE